MPEMDPDNVMDLLHTLAEVSIAFVGFSTVVAALGARGEGSFKLYSIRDVAIVGLIALGAAVLPLLLRSFGIHQDLIWRISSIVFSAGWLLSAYWGIRTYRRNVDVSAIPRYLNVGPVVGVVANPMLWSNAVFPNPYSGSLYVGSLILLLVFVSVSFIASIFHDFLGQSDADV